MMRNTYLKIEQNVESKGESDHTQITKGFAHVTRRIDAHIQHNNQRIGRTQVIICFRGGGV